jgi:uracil-DNA glycosylase
MSEPTFADVVRMLEQHLVSLRAAGIEWVVSTATPIPTAESLVHSPPLQRVAGGGAEAVGDSPSLFDDPGPTVPSPLSILSPGEKRLALQTLDASQVKGCTKCAELARTRTQTVFGVGNPNADLLFIGEAPGADEDRLGEPFVGLAGQLLDKIIAACGLKREQVYIGNVLKCRPPGNRTPLPDEIANCRGYLEEQIRIIQPKYICCLGAIAAQALLNSQLSIGKLRKKFHNFQGIPVLCTYHPAYLLRTPTAKKEVWDDMKLLLTKMGKPIPQGK